MLHYRNESAEAHYLLSKVGQGRQDTASQKDELGQALRLDKRSLNARIDLARLLLANRRAQAALQILDEAPPDQKDSVPIVLQRNWVLLALGQTADARKGIDRLLATGRVPDSLLQDAAVKLGQKDYAGARAAVERDLSQNPADVRALNLLVQTYAAQKQMPAGLDKAREYALRQPASGPVQLFLGELLATTGDRVGARAKRLRRPSPPSRDFSKRSWRWPIWTRPKAGGTRHAGGFPRCSPRIPAAYPGTCSWPNWKTWRDTCGSRRAVP